MPIDSASQLAQVLEKHGYAPKISDQSVFVPLGRMQSPFTASFSFTQPGKMQITCQLAVLGDFPEDSLAQLGLAALDANTQISPYAFAIIGSAEKDVDIKNCPLVLIDTLATTDLSEAEITFTLDKLLEALTFSAGILKLGLTVASA